MDGIGPKHLKYLDMHAMSWLIRLLQCSLVGDRTFEMANWSGATPQYWRGGWANSPTSDSGGNMEGLFRLRKSGLAPLKDAHVLYGLEEELQSCPSRHPYEEVPGVCGLWPSTEGHSIPT